MSVYADFDRFLQGQRQRISIAEGDALARRGRTFSGLAAETKAGVFVWTAAALERFLSAFLTETLAFINDQGLRASELRYSLFTLACEPQFHVVRTADPRAAWSSRLKIMNLLPSDAPISVFGRGPLDGKTIRAYHFDAVWEAFGLSGSPWPSPVHKRVLEDLADSRNDLAHGVMTSVDFGRRRTFEDCMKMLSRIDGIVTHAVIEMDSYLQSGGYRR